MAASAEVISERVGPAVEEKEEMSVLSLRMIVQSSPVFGAPESVRVTLDAVESTTPCKKLSLPSAVKSLLA